MHVTYTIENSYSTLYTVLYSCYRIVHISKNGLVKLKLYVKFNRSVRMLYYTYMCTYSELISDVDAAAAAVAVALFIVKFTNFGKIRYNILV